MCIRYGGIFVRFDYPDTMTEREKIQQSIIDGTKAAKMTDRIKAPMNKQVLIV